MVAVTREVAFATAIRLPGVDHLEHLVTGGHPALQRARIAVAQQLLRLVIDIQLGQIGQSIAQTDEMARWPAAEGIVEADRIGNREMAAPGAAQLFQMRDSSQCDPDVAGESARVSSRRASCDETDFIGTRELQR